MKFIFMVLLISGSLSAQACCTAGNPMLGSLEMSTGAAGRIDIGITYQYNFLGDVLSGSESLNDNLRERVSEAILTEISYGLTNRITITGLFSFINQERTITPAVGQENNLSTRGAGDVLLLIKYSVIPLNILNNRELAFGGGIKVPTGSSTINSGGILLPADMQPGSGSWDAVFWGFYSEGLIKDIPLNMILNSSYRFNGNNNRFGDNNEGYQFGNEFLFSAGLTYRTNLPFDFSVFTRIRSTSSDKLGRKDIDNTGGTWIYVVPGVNYRLDERLTGRVSVQLPVYREVTGTQLTTSFTASASLFYSFDIN